MIARYVNRQGRIIIIVASPRSLPDENYAPLREAVLPAQPEEPRAMNDRAKGPTRGGRREMIVMWYAGQEALQHIVGRARNGRRRRRRSARDATESVIALLA